MLVGAGVADPEGAGVGVVEVLGVGVGPAEELGLGVGVTVELGVGAGAGAGVMLVVIPVRQVTVAPPPLPEPLHWLTETRSADDVVEPELTVHRTLCVPPPPLPELLHWVTIALVVLAGNGSHAVVGAVPPPVPEALHWLTVADVGVPDPVMLLMTSTVHSTVPPPPFPDPLHWSMDVTKLGEEVVEELQTIVGGALAAP